LDPKALTEYAKRGGGTSQIGGKLRTLLSTQAMWPFGARQRFEKAKMIRPGKASWAATAVLFRGVTCFSTKSAHLEPGALYSAGRTVFLQ